MQTAKTIESILKRIKPVSVYMTAQLGVKQFNREARTQTIHLTKKTKRGIPAFRFTPGASRPARVKGDTRDAQSPYFKGEQA